MSNRLFLLLSIILTNLLGSVATAANVQEKILTAIASESRPAADVSRDANRKPLETLSFFRLRDDMRVLELIPGGGWYTRILAPVLRDNGEFSVAIATDRVVETVLQEDGFEQVKVIAVEAEMERTGPFRTREMSGFSLGVNDLDMVLTFRNMHNFTAAGRASINQAVFESLKPGGLYGVIDHTRRHMEPINDASRRRVDVAQIIHEVQLAGFRLVDLSDLHYRPSDALILEVGDASVTGNTDRFTLLFERL